MNAPTWFAFSDVDARPTFGAWFGDANVGGCLLWRPFEPVAFSDDPIRTDRDRHAWRWSIACAATMDDAIDLATAIAVNEARAYRAREGGGTGGKAGRPSGVTRARAWLACQPASVAKSDGDRTLARVALVLVRGFCLEVDGPAGVLLEEFDRRSEPPWGEAKRRRVLVWAEAHGRMPWGEFLNRSPAPQGRGAGRGPGDGTR